MNSRRGGLVSGIAVVLGVSLAASDAHAYHTPRKRITDNTAYTLRESEIRVGLWKVQYGISGQVMVGTYILPWLILAPNGDVKWLMVDTGQLALALSAGALYADTTILQWVEDATGPAQILALPFELIGSWRFDDRFTASLGPTWTLARVQGRLDQDAASGAGQGAGDNFQAIGNFEWRLSRVVALTLDGRFCFLQKQELGGDASSSPDDFTQVDAWASGNQNYVWNGGWSIALSAVLSWRLFNLRAGIGYGNFNVPVVNFVAVDKTVFPVLDFYWIW